MLQYTGKNTQGLIAKYLETYKNIKCYGGDVNDYADWYKTFIKDIDNPKMVIALDIEAKKIYCKDNFITHFSVCYKHNDIYYSYCFTVRDLDNNLKARIFNSFNNFKSKIVLHNAYYDIGQIKVLHNVDVKWDYDTYIIFHTLMSHRAKEDSKDFGDEGEEDKGLSLKDFTRDYLPYGDYEETLEKEKKRICKELDISVKKFTYDLFSDEIIMPYNCFDTLCTLQAFEVSLNLFTNFKNLGLENLKEIINVKKKAMDIYIKAYSRGIEVDYNKVEELGNYFGKVREESKIKFIQDYKKEIKLVEDLYRIKEYEKIINESMIDYIGNVAQKGIKKGKTEKREDKKNYYKKTIVLTDKQSEKIVESSTFSLTSSVKKTTLFVEILGLKPLDKGTAVFTPLILDEKDDIFSKCWGYKLNEETKKRERKLLSPKTDINFLTTYLPTNPNLQSILDFGKCNTALNNFLGVYKTEEDKTETDGKTLAELTDKGKFNIVYPSYNILGTITNRCSCQRPNLQQIPARGVLSPLKECFKAREGYYFYYSDYSSAEIVILTAIIDSKRFKEALLKGWDLHSLNVWFMLKDRVLAEAPEFQEMWDSCKTDDDYKKFYKEIKNRFENTLRYQCKSLN